MCDTFFIRRVAWNNKGLICTMFGHHLFGQHGAALLYFHLYFHQVYFRQRERYT